MIEEEICFAAQYNSYLIVPKGINLAFKQDAVRRIMPYILAANFSSFAQREFNHLHLLLRLYK